MAENTGNTNKTVGFVGLGIMGKPMVRNLMKAGFTVIVHNRSRGAVDEMVAEGAVAGENPADIARKSQIVITMLPDSPDVESVVYGENGLLGAMGQGSLLVDMSTIAPATSQGIAKALADKGASALDAPVSGGEPGAKAATLSIMVGGSEADFQRATPLFEAMGKTIVHVGEAGAGQIVKACNQVVVAINYAAVSEALVLGSKAGVDPAKIVQVLGGGLAASRVMEMRGQSMIDHNFQPGFRINLHRKDLGIANATARENGVPLPFTALVTQMMEAAVARDRGDLDHSALLTTIEDMAGHRVTRKT